MTRIDAPFLADPGLRRVLSALTGDGHQALVVGGAVRNALMGAPVSDTDIATSAHPDRVIELTEAAGLRAVPTGIEHGTITVVADGKGYEVTTLRRDVETDGRRAVVAFSDDIAEDAQRRDFTMNALYCGLDGVVLDPVGGLPDLAARRLRFVGEPRERIAEDYLRILRFFRFHAWYGAPGQADPDALAACADAADGLALISRERVGAEMRKLLTAPDPSEALALMDKAGVLALALPGADIADFPALIEAEQDFGHGALPGWPRRLAVLGASDVAHDLRLSRDEARMQDQIAQATRLAAPEAAYRFGRAIAAQSVLVRAARGDVPPFGWCHAVAHAADAKFPLSAQDLMDRLSGPALGQALRRAEDAFIASGFALSRDELRSLALERPATDQG
ncbi:CCA tRNA nucleotidyltransferase [Paracoccus laeviglucosivorans]|uniref:Poly(A) polymerase n=1 Tax=Paracoccus laeviglucosivorans TaxID=1197861 RepID=A0A521EFN9_9RHOB|nr:CCA tRNA nucleotidyltransferase [Paracoccus laeviglucosivorans]SMO82724.1 poly(A) polymerase [Paracoccus laeviglucosivorans]